MPVIDVPWEQARSEPFRSTPLGQIVEALRGATCSIYRSMPQWAVGDPIGIGAMTRAIWDAVCPLPEERPPSYPPPINQLPQGGRCECVPYQLVVSRRVGGIQQSNIVFEVNGPVVVRGWVEGNAGEYDFRIDHRTLTDCSVRTYTNIYANINIENISPTDTWVEVVSITRVDGGPDRCGYQPPIYPPVSPPPEPAMNFDVPVQISPGVTINIPVVFVKPSLDVGVNLQPQINISPSFNLDLGPDIDVNISLGFGGPKISIQPKPSPPGGPSLPPSPAPDPRQPKPLPPRFVDPDEEECCEELSYLLEEVRKKLQDLAECACPPPPDSRSLRGQGESGEVVLSEGSRAVEVQVVKLPPRARSWDGGNAPSPITAGWAWFKFDDQFMGSRVPVDATRKVFEVPKGAIAFAWTLYHGGDARVFVRSKT